MKRDPRNVFVNVPFDPQFESLFSALVFTITACGFRVRCALEDDDSGNIRMDKLERLLRESPRSIHDLSRVETGENNLPRFNMPFELGMAVGCKLFVKGRRSDAIKIMVRKPFELPAYLSDLGGNDPAAHKDNPQELIAIVSRFLHKTPEGKQVPGPQHLFDAFAAFNVALPDIAKKIKFKPEEVRPFTDYRVYLMA